jgi:VIT1/CCC1 family predicted Fe2+/Mn2+ transporter
LSARPLQAALASAASFAVGAALPLAAVLLVPQRALIAGVSLSSLLLLALLGAVASRVGGASPMLSAWRVVFWGALVMAITAGVGAWFGTVA